MLSRVCIFSESAGVCFLDKKWENAPGGRSMDQDTNSVVSLIKFFYQLSREIDDGNVNRVTFQPPQRKARLESHKGYQPRFGTVAMPKKHPENAAGRHAFEATKLELATAKSGGVVIGAFYSSATSYSKVKPVMVDLAAKFARQYRNDISQYETEFASRTEGGVEMVFEPFVGFVKEIENNFDVL